MIQNIHSVHIYVPNQAEAIRFYKDVLGFELRRWEALGPAGSWIEMGPPGSSTAIVLYPRDAMPDWQNRQSFIFFDCADIEQTVEALTARGVQFTSEVTSLGWGLMALFNDPYGNGFALVQVTRAAAVPPGAAGGGGRGGPPPPPPGRGGPPPPPPGA